MVLTDECVEKKCYEIEYEKSFLVFIWLWKEIQFRDISQDFCVLEPSLSVLHFLSWMPAGNKGEGRKRKALGSRAAACCTHPGSQSFDFL